MIGNKVVVGTLLISQSVEFIDLIVSNLLQWCDWIVLTLDNESPEVVEKVNELQKRYYDRIWTRRSSIPHDVITRNGSILNYHNRWKASKGIIRNDVFNNLKSILALNQKGYEKIDILLWADHDTIFTDYLPELLEKFVASDKKAISMKHVDVIGDMQTITEGNIGHHVHILKWHLDLAGLPRRFYALYHPLTERDLMKVENYSVHLAYLTEKNRKWRHENWKTDKAMERKMVKLEKNVVEMRSEEIKEILNA